MLHQIQRTESMPIDIIHFTPVEYFKLEFSNNIDELPNEFCTVDTDNHHIIII